MLTLSLIQFCTTLRNNFSLYRYISIPTQIITSSNFSLTDKTAKELTDMAHQGIKLLTNWTTAVMELVSVL